MRVVKRKVIEDFGKKHPEASSSLERWYKLTRSGTWNTPDDVKQDFGTTIDFVGNDRAIFNIKGNEFRLIVEINYRKQAVFIRFLDTHKEYDKIDASTVKRY